MLSTFCALIHFYPQSGPRDLPRSLILEMQKMRLRESDYTATWVTRPTCEELGFGPGTRVLTRETLSALKPLGPQLEGGLSV